MGLDLLERLFSMSFLLPVLYVQQDHYSQGRSAVVTRVEHISIIVLVNI